MAKKNRSAPLMFSPDGDGGAFSPKSAAPVGVGLNIDTEGDRFYVVSVLTGGPAAESRMIQARDELTHVGPVPTKGAAMNQIRDLISGPRGTSITLTFMRAKSTCGDAVIPAQTFSVTLERGFLALSAAAQGKDITFCRVDNLRPEGHSTVHRRTLVLTPHVVTIKSVKSDNHPGNEVVHAFDLRHLNLSEKPKIKPASMPFCFGLDQYVPALGGGGMYHHYLVGCENQEDKDALLKLLKGKTWKENGKVVQLSLFVASPRGRSREGASPRSLTSPFGGAPLHWPSLTPF